MSDKSQTTTNQVGLRLGEMLPGSTDNGDPGVPVAGKPVSIASWIRGRVVSIPHRRSAMITLGDIEHVISREQAVALGTRLLEVGIGTSFMEERAVNARIAEIISAWERNKP